MPKITKLEPDIPLIKPRLKVAAYARVSMETDRLMHSLSAQISYYSDMIQKNLEWEYAGVYADRFISGTSIEKRAEFQRMIADCEDGKINIILCKSISRFARNTVDLLNTVRHLKELGIEVRFEKEGIHTLSSDGEVLLTLLASFAEQESVSLSENLKWAIQKKFERGEPWGQSPYGYQSAKNDYIIVEKEAYFIRRIYEFFLDDMPISSIAKWLKENGCECTTKHFVKSVLTNISYTGDMILQEHYSPKVRVMRKNNGEVPKYYVKEHHPAIISHEIFETVQAKIQSEKSYNQEAYRLGRVSCFSSKITCAVCGNHYVSYGGSLVCYGKLKSRKKTCKNGNLIKERLEKICAEVLETDVFDGNLFVRTVHNLLVYPDGNITFSFYDGREKAAKIKFFSSEEKRYMDPHTKIYGYAWNGSEYIVNEAEAAAIRMVFADYLNGMSISEISRKMENLGYHSKRGKFSRKLILYLLSNPFYIGTRIYPAAYSGTGKEEIVENDHAAIIDREIFEKARILREKSLEIRKKAIETIKKEGK